MKYCTLDKRHIPGRLFADCARRIYEQNPYWNKERIIQCFLHNDFHFFVCTEDLNPDIAVAVFMYGPVPANKLIVVYADLVVKEFCGKGIGDNMTVEFMIWASNIGFIVARPQQ